MFRRPWLWGASAVVWLAGCPVATAQSPPAPAEYVGRTGSGVLRIDAAGRFKLDSNGANGHACQLEGEIHNARADVATGVEGETCIVFFRPTERGVAVTSEGGGCRSFCGARAGFKGEYLKPVAACSQGARAATRRRFSSLYAAKSYQQALAVLSPMFTQCEEILALDEAARIRNDLASTHYHLRQYTTCLKLLEPILDAAERAQANAASLEWMDYQPIARATRYNLELCRQPRNPGASGQEGNLQPNPK